jgi:CheY-like chemotaxis protein
MQTPRILVADNDPDVSSLLVEVLRMYGATAEVVPDGRAAVERLKVERFDLLICDLDMPELDGEGVVLALPTVPEPPPTFMISGYVDDATLGRLRQSQHVRAVLRKPFDVVEFAQQACAVAMVGHRPAAVAVPLADVPPA